jgi:hypothetical protein
MKTTAQRLSEVYCKPKGAKEWGMFGLIDIGTNYAVWSVDGKATVTDCNLPELFTQIPVQHFIDLIEDKIVAWRLVEDGLFKAVIDCDLYTLKNNNCDVCICIYYDGTFEVCLQDEFTEIRMNVKTYTDLLTLIRFL